MTWHYDGEIRIKKMESAPFGTNSYILACPQSGEGVIVDTPGDPWRILNEAEGIEVKHIIITHSHFDHLGGLKAVRAKLGAPIAIHKLEAGFIPLSPDWILKDGDVVSFGTVSLNVIHTPGHSPGSLCLLSGKHLISGDTLFPGGPGKTSTPADFEQIVSSITEKLFILPDETLVYPGHGDDTVLAKEKQEFAVFSSRPQRAGLCGDVLWLSS